MDRRKVALKYIWRKNIFREKKPPVQERQHRANWKRESYSKIESKLPQHTAPQAGPLAPSTAGVTVGPDPASAQDTMPQYSQ